MSPLAESILSHAQSLPEGGVLSPLRFVLKKGGGGTVRKVFTRLTRQGKLLRVAHGTYVAPVSSRFGSRAPAAEKVVEALAEQNHEKVAPHGASAANVLGLTQQVPVRIVYLTSGPTRTLTVGNLEVLMKHAPEWKLALGNRPAGNALRALDWLGKDHATEAVAKLRRVLTRKEWSALAEAEYLRPWMAVAIGQEAAGG